MLGREVDLSLLAQKAVQLDHIAIAVEDLEASITWYTKILGFHLKERRRTEGKRTGMISAVLEAGPITIVLIQGTSPESQVTRYIEAFGPGVQHIAIQVNDLGELATELESSGLEFDTSMIQGDGIRQIFTKRDPHSGMMYEFIERQREDGRFTDESVRSLFQQLESSDSF